MIIFKQNSHNSELTLELQKNNKTISAKTSQSIDVINKISYNKLFLYI